MSDDSDQSDVGNATIQMLAAISGQLNSMVAGMERLGTLLNQYPRQDNPETARQGAARGFGEHQAPPPPPFQAAPPPFQAAPQPFQDGHQPFQAPPPPPPLQHPDVKLNPPTFAGRVDPESYLDWERRMEHIFDYYRYADPRRVALATAQFTDHALTWWDREVTERRRNRYGNIITWEELKYVMRRRYVPPHFHRDMQKRFRRLTQGTKSVEEYYEEFEHLRNRLEIEDSLESLMAQFVDGLQERISRKVERHTYHDLGELLHLAIQIEQQNKRKSASIPRPKTTWNPTFKPNERSGPQPPSDNRFKAKVNDFTKTSRPGPSTPQAAATTSSSAPRSRDILCFKCNGRGHIARECPNQRTMILTPAGEYESEDDEESEPRKAGDSEDIEYPDSGELLMIRRVLNTMVKPEEVAQRENIFHTRCTIQGKVCSLIIDSGSCINVASSYMVDKLGLERSKHPHPYKLRWLDDKAEFRISDQVKVPFSVGRYKDQVMCDVVPMQAGHLLLGRPWQFDKETTHNGRTNLYSFEHESRRYSLAPLSPQTNQRHAAENDQGRK